MTTKKFKRFLFVLGLGFIILTAHSAAASIVVDLYVDSAPNAYGSPNWGPWWSQTKVDVVGGGFTNLRTGTFPGTTTIDPYDEIVYSTMDLGKRLHWIYWVPNETTTSLNNLFEVKWVIDWGGNAWTLSGSAWALDGPEVGWSQPLSWENYSGGVIGSLGFAWWATDDEALPFTTDGNAYNETNQADIDALRAVVFASQTYAVGMVRYRDTVDSPWQYTTLQAQVVPIPPGAWLLGSGLLGLVGLRRRFAK